MNKIHYPPRILLFSWLALLALLASTVIIAYAPLGVANTVVAIGIALTKSAFVAAIFMELRARSALMLVFAAAGFFWLGIMLWLALTDYVTRPNFPPAMRWGV